ncbi:hypothetical protein BGW36DRAFT_426611 [Talaromyces proteolyticus]|uniref:Uncharacterized protein n=1 Tax=Talaromyces proteolyticus TaxID=1131652 RepID=A0AAD4KXA2_9EURO|nr:uncharacterized protein BGW36DRAFT_426611 [Talaromyces proteolyticus]KAH8698928.1 hypothetical protein BGW36DRAFT_426611 [Talaromyces proteolyticus]
MEHQIILDTWRDIVKVSGLTPNCAKLDQGMFKLSNGLLFLSTFRYGTISHRYNGHHYLCSAQTERTKPRLPDFPDFFLGGYVITKNALSKERARKYQTVVLTWLESFGLGFDRDDKKTWKRKTFPGAGKVECISTFPQLLKSIFGMLDGKSYMIVFVESLGHISNCDIVNLE